MPYVIKKVNLDQEDMNKGLLSFFKGFKDSFSDLIDNIKGKKASTSDIKDFIEASRESLKKMDGSFSKEIDFEHRLYKYLPAYNLYIKDSSEFDTQVDNLINYNKAFMNFKTKPGFLADSLLNDSTIKGISGQSIEALDKSVRNSFKSDELVSIRPIVAYADTKLYITYVGVQENEIKGINLKGSKEELNEDVKEALKRKLSKMFNNAWDFLHLRTDLYHRDFSFNTYIEKVPSAYRTMKLSTDDGFTLLDNLSNLVKEIDRLEHLLITQQKSIASNLEVVSKSVIDAVTGLGIGSEGGLFGMKHFGNMAALSADYQRMLNRAYTFSQIYIHNLIKEGKEY